MTGIELIAKERQEQIEKHNRRVIDDIAQNSDGELILVATILLKIVGGLPWPTKWDKEICNKMYQKSHKERMIIAGALIAAEIDRIQKLEGE